MMVHKQLLRAIMQCSTPPLAGEVEGECGRVIIIRA